MKTPRTRPAPDRRQVAAGAAFLWIALSPWLWGFANSHAAVANHVSLVLGFAPLAVIMVNLRAAAVVTLLGGIWLTASPWVLGYATDHAAWLNELVTGTALVALCASAAGVGSSVVRARGTRAERRRGAPAVAAKTVGSSS